MVKNYFGKVSIIFYGKLDINLINQLNVIKFKIQNILKNQYLFEISEIS